MPWQLRIGTLSRLLLLLILATSLSGFWPIPAQSVDDGVETLPAIEVPGTVIEKNVRDITIDKPSASTIRRVPAHQSARASLFTDLSRSPSSFPLLRDEAGAQRAIRTPVQPAKAERPGYPRLAREQGWEGTVTLRLRIGANGLVQDVDVRKSSGYPSLDESAVQTVKQWRFKPARDGNFAVPTTVDLPIGFELKD